MQKTAPLYVVYITIHFFLDDRLLLYIADVAIWMSNFDDLDIHQISSKLAQRQCFVCNFDCEEIYTVSSLDNAENAKKKLFFCPTYNVIFSMRL